MASTLALASDQPLYQPGQLVTITATYDDGNAPSATTITVTGVAADSDTPPDTVTAQTTYDVANPPGQMTVTLTDDHGDVYVLTSNVAPTAVFTTTAPSV